MFHFKNAAPVDIKKTYLPEYRWTWGAVGTLLIMTFIFTLPTFLNGALFLYPDSATYIAQGQAAVAKIIPGINLGVPTLPQGESVMRSMNDTQRTAAPLIVGGRSIYYGILAYLAYGLTLGWATVALQGFCVAFPMLILMRTLAPDHSATWSVGLATALAFLTPIGLFVGFLMPDIWIGAMVLAIAALAVTMDRERLWVRAVLTLICSLAVLFHLSHLVILLAIMSVGGALWIWSGWLRRHVPARLGFYLGAVVAAGLAGHLTFSYTVAQVYGASPISRPHITAHLVDLGPGTDYARQACAAGTDLAICPYVDRLPMNWIAFLFDSDPATGVFGVAPDPVKRRLAEEEISFAIATLRYAPLETLGGLGWDGLSQLWQVSVNGIAMDRRYAASLTADFPAGLAQATQSSQLYSHTIPWQILTQLTYAGSFVALVTLVWAGFQSRMSRGFNQASTSDLTARLQIVMLVGITGFILNALVCGILASPFDRFQARVAWILPFLAIVVLAAQRQTRRIQHTALGRATSPGLPAKSKTS